MIDGAECLAEISFLPARKQSNQATNAVKLNWIKGKAGIANNFTLDVGFTQNDRLTYASIPEETSADCVGIIAIRGVVGITDNSRQIVGNIPYCGNMFLKYGVLVKVTFAFSNPEKLIEFYSQEAEDQIYSVITAKCTLELLIEDHDSDGAYVGFDAIKSNVQENFGIEIQDKHLKQAQQMLNSGVGGYSDMVTVGFAKMFTQYFKSNYGKGPMRSVLNIINGDLS